MTTTRDRLLALHAEASRQHIHFENRRYNRKTCSKALDGAIALTALATAASSMIETSSETTPATIAFATILLIATIVNLAVTDTEHEHDLHRLGDAWRRHRADAARLLARDGVQRSADAPQEIERNTVELECRIAETRSESLLHGLTLVETPSDQHEQAMPPSTARNR